MDSDKVISKFRVPTLLELGSYPTVEVASYLWDINGRVCDFNVGDDIPPLYYIYLVNEYNRRMREENNAKS